MTTGVASSEGQMPPATRRSFLHRALRAAGAVTALLLVALAIVISPYLFEPNRYEGVPSIERRSDFRDPDIMKTAWAMPVARAYLKGGFEYQDNPSFCGPTSVANVLRSLGRRTDQHRVIDGTRFEPTFGVLLGGLTLDELARLLEQRVGRPVQTVRGLTLGEFRVLLGRANDPRVRMIVNFHRGPLFGRGHGHHSPVLAYLADRDLVLVGDVNEDYRPFLVRSEPLWRAMSTVDGETGRQRGMIVAEFS